jgi:hypothetical protein
MSEIELDRFQSNIWFVFFQTFLNRRRLRLFSSVFQLHSAVEHRHIKYFGSAEQVADKK